MRVQARPDNRLQGTRGRAWFSRPLLQLIGQQQQRNRHSAKTREVPSDISTAVVARHRHCAAHHPRCGHRRLHRHPLAVAQSTYEQDVSNASQGMLRVVSFAKINGVSQNMYGQRLYELDYRAVVEFVQPGWTSSGAMFTLESPYRVYGQQPTGWDAWGNDFQYHEAGARIAFTGTMTLLKKENGWERT
jgi:hypothetical protein